MSRTLRFHLPIDPPRTTPQTRRFTRYGTYEPTALRDAKALIETALLPHRPAVPLYGALRMDVRWVFRTEVKSRVGAWKTTRPDTDNMVKLLKDCMGRMRFFQDDAQVCDERCRKQWGREPGIWVELEALE